MTRVTRSIIRRFRAFLRLALSQWPVRLILFAAPGLAVLIVMNLYWSSHIANIGCIGVGQDYHLEKLFVKGEREAKAGCTFSGRVHSASERITGTALGNPGGNLRSETPPAVAIADGRFQWMTFHLIAAVLYVAIALVAVTVMHRNLGRGLRAWLTVGAAAALGLGWWWRALGQPNGLMMETASLLVPTRIHALRHYDASFRDLAWQGVQLDYGGGLAVTILIIIAGASILAETGPGTDRSAATIAAKRRDLKLTVATAAALMTFLAFYVGEWLAWPARFAPSGAVRGSREEFEAIAAGLRLYFGAGYSLALVAAATPAILMLPKPGRTAAPEKGTGPAAVKPNAAAGHDEEGYFYQFVFTKDEVSLLLSVMTPFLATLAGGALQL
jgi:hypothetical protein